MRIDVQNFGIVKKANMSGVIFKENFVILHDEHDRAYIKLKSLSLLNGNPQYKLINISDVFFEPSLLIKLLTGDLAVKIYRKLEKI
jgi:hypothetical protein